MSLYIAGAIAGSLAGVYAICRIGTRASGLPPGPPTTPILGNVLQLPSRDAHNQITAWSREYGEIYSLKLGPGTAIVLSSPEAMKQILELQSADTSDRPPNSLHDLVTDGWSFFLCRYSARWRQMRKAAQALLSPAASKEYLRIQEAEATQLQFDILTAPENFFNHIHRFSTSIILSVVYGQRAPRHETPTAGAFAEVNTRWANYLRPGATPPVDLLPFLKYLPECLAPWKKEARAIRTAQRKLYLGLFDECQERVNEGDTQVTTFMTDLIRDRAAHEMNRTQMSMLAGSLYEAGAHTTAAFVHGLVMLLTAYPEVQAKAAAEMNQVVGDKRSPVHSDGDSLPYIRALIQEIHRFRVVTPHGLPHRATRDLHYKGYLIPEGSMLIANIHGLFTDPELFDAPEEFRPERFLLTEFGTRPGVDVSDFRSTFMFGMGRRICPGMHVATASILLAAMKLIWAFEFRPAIDEATGKPIKLDVHSNGDGLAVGPMPFKCDIRCRCPARAELVKESFRTEAAEILIPFERNLASEDKEWLESVRDHDD
ncbi:cytochrome P450 [Schizophyllum commune Loenen D]|nr:cytochrome P450 [Schizophyllum commune Loenen D]